MPEKNAWDKWKEIATKAATWQARVLLAGFYWVVITPFACVISLFGDPLGLKGKASGSWQGSSHAASREEY